MFEILSILLSVIIFLLFFSFPLPIFYLNKNNSLNYYDKLLLNIVIHCNIFLVLSFFTINTHFVFLLYIFISIVFFIYNFKNIFFFLKKNFSTISFFIITLYCLFVYLAQNAILNWDGAAHWFYKTQNFFQGTEYKNLKNLPFNYYPHLGSYIWAFFWKNNLLQIEYFGRFFFIFLFVSSCFSLGLQLNKNFSNFEKISISISLTYLSTNFFLLGGYQEYFLFFIFFVFGRLFLLLNLSLNSNLKNYIIILILLVTNLALWIKQEGFFYFIFLNVIFLIHYKSKIYFKFLYFFFSLILILIFLKVKIFFFNEVSFNENIKIYELYNALTKLIIDTLYSSTFLEIINKIYLIIKYILMSFIKYPIWIIIIFSSIILSLKYKYFKNNLFFLSYFILHLFLIFLVYFKHNDINTLLPLTLSRLIFPITGLYIFLIIILLNKIKK
jgi:hypothetical protein